MKPTLRSIKQNPELELFRTQMRHKQEMMLMMPSMIEETIRKNPNLMYELVNRTLLEIKNIQKGDTGEKGADGYTPKLGKDYFTRKDQKAIVDFIMSMIRIPEDGTDGKDGRDGKNGADGYTPKAGIDYPTTEQLKKLVVGEVALLFNMQPKKKELTEGDVMQLVGKLQEKVDFKARAAEIARALETLRGGERLDYRALKNKPIKEDARRKIFLRGGGAGGAETLVSDISSQCDGSNRTFTVPSHSSAKLLLGTDTPLIYKPTTDFTTSGTTLTIAAGTTAPSNGATLLFVYVQ